MLGIKQYYAKTIHISGCSCKLFTPSLLSLLSLHSPSNFVCSREASSNFLVSLLSFFMELEVSPVKVIQRIWPLNPSDNESQSTLIKLDFWNPETISPLFAMSVWDRKEKRWVLGPRRGRRMSANDVLWFLRDRSVKEIHYKSQDKRRRVNIP